MARHHRDQHEIQGMRSALGGVLTVGWAATLAFVITAYGQGLWGVLVATNLRTTPTFPWAVAVMAFLLWAMWQYLGGRWRPRSTSDARRVCLRARMVPRPVFGWALAAGVLSVAALTGCWIVMFQLVKMPANAIPDPSRYPVLTMVFMALMGSLAAPLSEEAAFRGYCQVILERRFGGPIAIMLSSLMFALAHLMHGLLWPKLLVYWFGGLVFGLTACLTRSILPGIAVHIIADLTFFTLVWPYDKGRPLAGENGLDTWFWVHCAQAVVFAGMAIPAFRQLARVAGQGRDVPDGFQGAALR
jgi:membrane protease YdiL (CAAX protease family)